MSDLKYINPGSMNRLLHSDKSGHNEKNPRMPIQATDLPGNRISDDIQKRLSRVLGAKSQLQPLDSTYSNQPFMELSTPIRRPPRQMMTASILKTPGTSSKAKTVSWAKNSHSLSEISEEMTKDSNKKSDGEETDMSGIYDVSTTYGTKYSKNSKTGLAIDYPGKFPSPWISKTEKLIGEDVDLNKSSQDQKDIKESNGKQGSPSDDIKSGGELLEMIELEKPFQKKLSDILQEAQLQKQRLSDIVSSISDKEPSRSFSSKFYNSKVQRQSGYVNTKPLGSVNASVSTGTGTNQSGSSDQDKEFYISFARDQNELIIDLETQLNFEVRKNTKLLKYYDRLYRQYQRTMEQPKFSTSQHISTTSNNEIHMLLEKEIHSVRQTLFEREQTIQQLQHRLQIAEEDQRRLLPQIENLTARNMELSKNNMLLSGEMQKMESDQKSHILQAELQNKNNELATKDSEIARLNQSLAEALDQNRYMQQEYIRKYEEKKRYYESEVHARDDKIRQLELLVEQKDTQLSIMKQEEIKHEKGKLANDLLKQSLERQLRDLENQFLDSKKRAMELERTVETQAKEIHILRLNSDNAQAQNQNMFLRSRAKTDVFRDSEQRNYQSEHKMQDNPAILQPLNRLTNYNPSNRTQEYQKVTGNFPGNIVADPWSKENRQYSTSTHNPYSYDREPASMRDVTMMDA